MEGIFYNILVGLVANSYKNWNPLDPEHVVNVLSETIHSQLPKHSVEIISTVLSDVGRVVELVGDSSVTSVTGVGISADHPDLPAKADRTSV